MSNEDFRRQIYGNLNLKETDELLSIWQTNNRAFWSDEAFEVIKEILRERSVEIPEQDEPVYEMQEEIEEQGTSEEDGLEEWEAKLLDDENQPEFYDPLEVLTLKDNINRVAKAVIVIYALNNLLPIPYYASLVRSYFPIQDRFNPLVYLIAIIIALTAGTVTVAIAYFPLKALNHILRILMEMEYASRKRSRAKSAE